MIFSGFSGRFSALKKNESPGTIAFSDAAKLGRKS